MPKRWQQVKELFAQALERAAHERAAYLAEACAGDEALRREVELLLSGDEKAGSFIETPALEVAAEAMAEGQGILPGHGLGAYQILSQLGGVGWAKPSLLLVLMMVCLVVIL